MATAVHGPSAVSFYNTDDQSQSGLFLNDSDSIGFGIASFDGENSSCCTSTTFISTWSDPCSDESSTFTPAATFFGLELNSPADVTHEPQLGYPTEDDILLDATSWMAQPSNQPVMHPTLVHTLKHMVTPESSSPDDEWRVFQEQEVLQHLGSPQLSPPTSDNSLTSQEGPILTDSDEGVQIIRHEPPPLNMKRLEKEEDPSDDNIEAAEVSVDLIQNRRPFQCGLAGCNKTFKNPQTMKMHHKTHYTDGSVITKDGVASLPTLTPTSLKAGQNKKIPSRCPKCRKTFVGLYELRRHYGRKHSEGEKPFGCRKCEKRFYIEVDVRDHEKLCGESIECKCGLKFAFKCNLVAHKKAHPACQESMQTQQQPLCNSQSTISDEDNSSHSRGSSISPPIPRSSSTIKRRYGQGEEISRNIMRNPAASKQMKYNYYSSGLTTPPAFSDYKGTVDASTTFKAAFYDFAGLHFSTEGSSLWSSNMHYPSSVITSGNLPSTLSLPSSSMYSSSVLLGAGLEHLGSQIYSKSKLNQYRHPNTRLELMDTAPAWNSSSIPGL